MMHTTAFYQTRTGFIIVELSGLHFLAILVFTSWPCLFGRYNSFLFLKSLAFVQPSELSFYIRLNLFISVYYRSISNSL